MKRELGRRGRGWKDGAMRKFLVLLTVAAAALTGACGGSSEPSGSAATTVPDGPPVIKAVGTVWKRAKVTTTVAEPVTWVVEKGLVHDLVGADGVKHDAGQPWTYQHRFTKPGTYDYQCTLHAGMTGTVTVK